jgi:NADPH-dependent 2,4-dienoyl-CoA reductase/sulfur reductase-like enzyme/rhodanese-related sulfurtransferase
MIELMKAKKIIIVGAVACGAGVASRLRRLDESVKIILIDKGNYLSFSNCGLPYYIGKEVDDIRKIDGKDAEVFAKLSNIDVRLNHEVLEIDIKNKLINVQDNNQNISYKESYDDLVLSLGAVYDMPEIPGIVSHNHFTVLTIPDALKIDQYINENNVKKAVVIGGGYIGLEVIEQLKNRGLEVSLVTHSDQVLNNLDREMVSMIHQELQEQNIATYLNVDIARFENCGNRSKVILRNYPDAPEIEGEIIILATGIKPNSGLAKKAGLKLGEKGGIKVNKRLQTSDKNIWAGGDSIEVENLITKELDFIPLAGPASRHGHIIADNILGASNEYRATLGTAILKFFDLAIATTGISEKQAKAKNIKAGSIIVHANSHVGYYHGAKPLTIKLIYSSENFRILGAQIVGNDGVDKRIDILSTAIQGNATVSDLDDLQLAYAPPFGSARDPINQIGMIGQNIQEARLNLICWQDIEKLGDESIILDVRTLAQRAEGFIEQSINIPYEDLRDNHQSLDKEKEIVVYCHSGSKSYFAYRFLELVGFNKLRMLSGGYKTYKLVKSLGGKTKEVAHA